MRALVKQYVEDAYLEGLAEGGASPDEISAEDAQNIDELNARQQDYIAGFTTSARLATDEITKQAILDRIEMWAESIYNAGQAGWVAAMGRKKMRIQWHSANDDFVDDGDLQGVCARLNGAITVAGDPFRYPDTGEIAEDMWGRPLYAEKAHFGCRCTTTPYVG